MADKKKKPEKVEEKPKAEEAPAEVHEEVKLEVEKNVMAEVPTEEEIVTVLPKVTFDVAAWEPKTSIGKAVKAGEIKDIDDVLDKGLRIFEAPITDVLLPNMESDLLLVGQSKGKFGGGQRRVFRQTQKKTPEGNKPKFGTVAVIGNKDGYVGIGYGKSKETVPAREKSMRNAKMNIFKIRRGCGSWQCSCGKPHSIPFKVKGKCGSVEMTLMPAPKGKGLCIEPECAKILKLVGIKDVWSETWGQTGSKLNLITACEKALKELMRVKISQKQAEKLGIAEGRITKNEN